MFRRGQDVSEVNYCVHAIHCMDDRVEVPEITIDKLKSLPFGTGG
jgi:hypothetical protein